VKAIIELKKAQHCANCDCISEIDGGDCPSCTSRALTPLATFLNRQTDDNAEMILELSELIRVPSKERIRELLGM